MSSSYIHLISIHNFSILLLLLPHIFFIKIFRPSTKHYQSFSMVFTFLHSRLFLQNLVFLPPAVNPYKKVLFGLPLLLGPSPWFQLHGSYSSSFQCKLNCLDFTSIGFFSLLQFLYTSFICFFILYDLMRGHQRYHYFAFKFSSSFSGGSFPLLDRSHLFHYVGATSSI